MTRWTVNDAMMDITYGRRFFAVPVEQNRQIVCPVFYARLLEELTFAVVGDQVRPADGFF